MAQPVVVIALATTMSCGQWREMVGYWRNMEEESLSESALERVQAVGEEKVGTRHVAAVRPEAAVGALMDLASGETQVAVAARNGMNRSTVQELARDNKEWIASWRDRQLREVAGQAEMAQRLAKLKMQELLDDDEARAKVSVKDLAVTQAVYLDKVERLAGAPDVRVEVEARFGLEDAREFLAGLKRAAGRVVEPEPIECGDEGSSD